MTFSSPHLSLASSSNLTSETLRGMRFREASHAVTFLEDHGVVVQGPFSTGASYRSVSGLQLFSLSGPHGDYHLSDPVVEFLSSGNFERLNQNLKK